MKFLLFHGSFGNPEENWFGDLKNKLENIGQHVIVPRYPVDSWEKVTAQGANIPLKNQSLENWLSEFEKILPEFRNGPLCFVGHSLGPLFILHCVEKYSIQLDSAIFVCPFLDKLNKSWQIDHANSTFYKTDFDFGKLRKLIPISYVVFSTNDPYVDKKYSVIFAKSLQSSLIEIKNAGHISASAGFTKLPIVYDLCTSRLDLKKFITKL